MIKSKFKLIFLLALPVLFSACSSSVRFSSQRETPGREQTIAADIAEYENIKPLETVTGTASYYADEYHNKVTYSGEIYDMYGISAAHPLYPMGTVVRVTKLSDGKEIVLTINDKMPKRDDRIIDLSLGAARELGMVQAGLAEVKVEVLKWGEGKK